MEIADNHPLDDPKYPPVELCLGPHIYSCEIRYSGPVHSEQSYSTCLRTSKVLSFSQELANINLDFPALTCFHLTLFPRNTAVKYVLRMIHECGELQMRYGRRTSFIQDQADVANTVSW